MHQDEYAPHVSEAISALGYVKPEYASVLEALMPRCMTEHPHAVAREIRKTGTQITDDEKTRLGIKRNGFMSREALSMLTDHGKQHPLLALENTLLRALFSCYRERHIEELYELQRQCDKPVFALIKGAVADCPGCAKLDLKVRPSEAAAQFPIVGCSRDACAVLMEADIDFLTGVN